MDPRDIKRFIIVSVLIIAGIFVFVNNMYYKKFANDKGYDTYGQYKQDIAIEKAADDFKQIVFCMDNSLDEENFVVQKLTEDGYEINTVVSEYATYTDEIYLQTATSKKIKVIYGGNLYQYLKENLVEEKEKTDDETNASYDTIVENFVKLCDENTIIITDPAVNVDYSEFNEKVPYEHYVDLLIKACKENNVRYINLYEHTKINPITITNDNFEKLSKTDQEFLYNELTKNLNEIIKNYKESLR